MHSSKTYASQKNTNRMARIASAPFLICAVLSVIAPWIALAATDQWSGTVSGACVSGNNTWSTGACWSTSSPPAAGSNVSLSQSGLASPTNYDLNQIFASLTLLTPSAGGINGYTINNSGGTFGIQPGGQIDDQNARGPDTLNMGVTLGGDVVVRVEAGVGGLTFGTNPITGSGSVTFVNFSAADALTLNVANTYVGETIIGPSGEILANVNGAIPTTSDMIVNTGGVIKFAQNSAVASIAGPGTINLPGVTLTADANPSVPFFGTIAGTGGLTKVGTGNLLLEGNNTTTGTLTINSGTVTLIGSWSGNVVVGPGGTLNVAGGTISGTITTAPAITSGTTATGTYGTAGFSYTIGATNSPTTLSETGTLPTGVTFNSGTGVISGTPTQIGTFNVTIDAGNAAGTATQGLAITINKAPLTVTADDKTITYGALPSFTATITGFVNSDTSSVVSGAANLSAVATLTNGHPNAGTYTIRAGQGSLSATNYTFTTFNTGTLTVNKAPITVAADLQNTTYGQTPPTYTAAINGFTNGDTFATAASGAPAFSDNATRTNGFPNHGVWTITPSVGTLTAANYAFTTFLGATLSVNSLPLTVTADPITITYGTSPTQTVSFSGFVNGDTAATAVTGSASFVNNATLTNGNPNVGSWTITPTAGTLAATNYFFSTFKTGTLTVNQAVLTVTGNNASIAYGSAAPTFTAGITGFVNSDTASVVSGAASLSTNTTLTNGNPNAGSWNITPAVGTLTAANYSFGFTAGTLTVSKIALTVTANPQTLAYGVAPTLTATVTGFVNGDTVSVVSGAAGLSTNATLTNGNPNAGSWTITPTAGSLAASNYTFSTFNTAALTVSKVALTVTANPQTIAYGSATPTLTAGITGFVNGDTVAVVGGAASLSTNATLTNGNPNAGSWTITPLVGTLAAANYTFGTFNTGTFTVNKATLTVTANNISKAYGAALPTLTAAITGFVNGDTSSVVSGAASLATTATATSTAGPYTITTGVGTLTAANYSFTPVNGTLTVSQVPLTVSATNVTRTFGSATPALGFTITGFVNGDTTAVVTGSPSLSTTASPNSNAGTYPITISQGGLASTNYSFGGFNSATLTIQPVQTDLGITSITPGVNATLGQNFQLTVTVAGVPGAPAPTGTIAYSVDGGAAQSAALVSDSASITIAGLGMGAHHLTLSYSGDTNYLPVPSHISTLNVAALSTKVNVAVSPSVNVTTGQAVTLTFTLTGTPLPTGTISYTVDSGTAQSATITSGNATATLNSLAAGTHVVSYSYSGDTNYGAIMPQTVTLTVTAAQPAINTGGIVGAAGVSASISPGGIGSVYGANLAGSATSANSLPLPTMLGGVQVLVNGQPAPLFYVSPTQINFQAPYEVTTGSPVQVVVIDNGVSSLPVLATFTAAAPSVFTYARTSTVTDPVILHSDNTLVTPDHPATAGEVLVIYATGAGPLNNTPQDGVAAPASPLATTKVTPVVMVGTANASVQFSGLTPGLVGLWQINVQLPASLPKGPTLSLVISLAGASSAAVNLYVSQ